MTVDVLFAYEIAILYQFPAMAQELGSSRQGMPQSCKGVYKREHHLCTELISKDFTEAEVYVQVLINRIERIC